MELEKSLNELKTSIVGGYSKESVQNLIERIILECQEDIQKEVSGLKADNNRLAAENRSYKEQNELLTGQFETLTRSMEKMTQTMEKEAEYTKGRDKELEGFYRREEELNQSLCQVREEAEKEKSRILEEAEQERKKLLEQANHERTNILKCAEEEKKALLQDAKEELGQLLERCTRIRTNLGEWKEKVDELFAWSDEALEKESKENQVTELLASLEKQQIETIQEENNMNSEMMIRADES